MITVPEHLEQPFLQLAKQAHQPVSQLIEQALSEFLDDWQDARLAEQAINEISTGESKVLSLTQARQLYDELVN